MKILKTLAIIIFASSLISPAMAANSREATQAKLDAACEAARQKELAPIRKEIIEQCVKNDERGSRAECERFYADYGERMGGRAPLFFDLPKCVEAFEFQQSARQRGS